MRPQHRRLHPEVDGTIEQYGDYTLLRVRTDRLFGGIASHAPDAHWVGRTAVEVERDKTWTLVSMLRKLGYTITGYDLN